LLYFLYPKIQQNAKSEQTCFKASEGPHSPFKTPVQKDTPREPKKNIQLSPLNPRLDAETRDISIKTVKILPRKGGSQRASQRSRTPAKEHRSNPGQQQMGTAKIQDNSQRTLNNLPLIFIRISNLFPFFLNLQMQKMNVNMQKGAAVNRRRRLQLLGRMVFLASVTLARSVTSE